MITTMIILSLVVFYTLGYILCLCALWSITDMKMRDPRDIHTDEVAKSLLKEAFSSWVGYYFMWIIARKDSNLTFKLRIPGLLKIYPQIGPYVVYAIIKIVGYMQLPVCGILLSHAAISPNEDGRMLIYIILAISSATLGVIAIACVQKKVYEIAGKGHFKKVDLIIKL